MVTSRLSPTATMIDLGALGFSQLEAQRLLDLKARFDRGQLHEVTREEQRLRFIRWLVEHEYLNEGVPNGRADGEGGDTEGGAWMRFWRSLVPSGL